MGRDWIAYLMPKHARFSVDYGRQIKTVVDGSRGETSASRSSVRQYGNSPGNFRLAKVIAVGTGLAAAACEVDVYGIRFTVTDFPEALGAQALAGIELSGTDTFAAAGIDDYIQLDDYVGIVTWNARHWIVQRFANCPNDSGGGDTQCMNYELTLSGYADPEFNDDHVLPKLSDFGTIKIFTKEWTVSSVVYKISFGINSWAGGHELRTFKGGVEQSFYTLANSDPTFTPFCTDCHTLDLSSFNPGSGLSFPGVAVLCPPGAPAI